MNFLVVNDDGIHAKGIETLVKHLATKGDVYVSAPADQQSAKSHAVTLRGTVGVEIIDFPNAKRAYKVSGTPADCAKVGIQFLKEDGINVDMVFTGINHGGNLGRDTQYSGTVGSAAEATLSGIQAIAVSTDKHEATHFEYAGKLAAQLVDLTYGKVPKGIVLNVNVPNLPEEEVKGIKLTRLGNRFYDDKFHLTEDGTYALSGNPLGRETHPEDADVVAIFDDYATITPIQFDFTAYEYLEEMKDWDIFNK